MSAMLLEEARKREDALAGFVRDIVSIPSLSGQEGEVVRFMADAMRGLGYDEVKVDGMGNLLGRIGNGPHVIAFDGHCDTADTGDIRLWTRCPPYPAVLDKEAGKICGRGCADQKGGLGAAVYGIAMLKELGRIPENLTIWVVASVQEEDCEGMCWQYIVREGGLRPEFVCLTAPTGLRIHHGQRGRMEIEIETGGVSCHGSTPERGENAVYKMAEVIRDVEALNGCLPETTPLGKGTVTLSRIRSTSPSLCAVADSCVIHLDRRLTAGETEESCLAGLRTLPGVEKANAKIRVLDYSTPSWTGLLYPVRKSYPAWITPADSPYVSCAVKSFRDTFGDNPEVSRWVSSTNGVAIRGMFQIPCIGFGPGDEKFSHGPNEEVAIAHLVHACAFYAALAEEYASQMSLT